MKRKNIIKSYYYDLCLMTIFSFLTILSKHSKEPVKPETKHITHHLSNHLRMLVS